MEEKNPSVKADNTANTTDDSNLKNITEQLYKQNLELAVRNKTLSLLKELYQISISTLEPEDLSNQVSHLILTTLDLELVSIYGYSITDDSLIPFGFYFSDKLKTEPNPTINYILTIPTIINISQNKNFDFLLNKKAEVFFGLPKLWPELQEENRQKIETAGHIKSSLFYPLIIKDQVIGALVLCFNRSYEELSQFERDSIMNIVNVIAVALDRATLDEQLKLANVKLKDLDRQKTEFVSIASHQLRSPLTAIKGYSSMILEESFGPISDKVRGAVDVIFQSSQKLVLVIEDFLDITRIELGKMKYEIVSTNLKEIADEVVKELEHSVKSHGLKLIYHPKEEMYPILADRGKISQVISNLIDNAMKYTQHGSISVFLERVGDKSRLSVKDTGIGIPAEVLSKLFQKFTRVNDVGKVNITGTGLGLYVAKQIMDAHGGKIWAESEGIPGRGSTFYLEL